MVDEAFSRSDQYIVIRDRRDVRMKWDVAFPEVVQMFMQWDIEIDGGNHIV